MSQPMNVADVSAQETIAHLQNQLDLANSRMQSANHAFQVKTNDALELHAQFLLIQKRNADLMKAQADHQKVVDELQKKVVELTEALKQWQDKEEKLDAA